MPLLVTSASGINGDGYGALLAFKRDGTLIGPFNDDSRIVDPRGLAVDQKEGLLFLNSGGDRVLALDPNGTIVRDTGVIAGLNPGGGNFGPDGRYYVGLRSARTVMAFPVLLDATGAHFVPPGIVSFPRGFAFGHDGRLFLASGIGPNGEGDNAIVAIAPSERTRAFRLVSDLDFSPLDLAIARPTVTSWCQVSIRSARQMPCRACANTTLRMDTLCVSSLPTSWPSFGNRAVYGLVLTGISTASLRTRSSPSILRRARAWEPQCNSSA
jgi:hypothetical protein